MGLLDLLGLRARSPGSAPADDIDAVRRIMRELESLPAESARFVAAFAYILGRVARADLDISAAETVKMEEIVRAHAGLPEAQAVLVVEIAKAQNRLFGSTENFVVTREFKEVSTLEQRAHLLDCLFAVSAADDSISSAEETQVRLIAGELGFSHQQFVASRHAWSSKRAVMRGLAAPGPGSEPARG